MTDSSSLPEPQPSPHPALALNDVVHQRVRLAILTVLSETQECKFSTLRDELKLTDGNLNRHLRVLEQASLLQVVKGYEGRRPTTWLRLTRQGRAALRAEIAALEQLVSRVRDASTAHLNNDTDAP
nr:transcriptional regulator [Micromonospora viridifaciens]